MSFFKNLSLNNLYLIKKLDFFSFNVQLRIQRSKEGGRSDDKIGSYFGVLVSVFIVFVLVIFVSSKIHSMNSFENVTYTSIEMKNKFENSLPKGKDSEILIADHVFMPSIDY